MRTHSGSIAPASDHLPQDTGTACYSAGSPNPPAVVEKIIKHRRMFMKYISKNEPVVISPRLSATIDFLRWTSAFAVLAGHVRAFFFPPYGEFANSGLLTKAFYLSTGFGHQAVMVFFVLSGFLVGGRALEKIEDQNFRLGNYMIDRISRLYPVFFACLLLTAGLDWVGATYFHKSGIYSASAANPIGVIGYNAQSNWGILPFIINLFMLQGLAGPTFGSNGPLWSLSMEWWYYLLFPLSMIPFYATSCRTRWLWIVALIPILFLLSRNLEFYTLFVVWLGVFARKFRFPIRQSWIAFLILALSLANCRFGFGSSYIRDLLVGVGCMLVVASMTNGGWFPLVGAKFSKRAANFSYSVYCCHFPIVALTVAYFYCKGSLRHPTLAVRHGLTGAVIAVCLIVSYAISRITEAKTSDIRQFIRRRISE